MSSFKILFFGDVIGKPGRLGITHILPSYEKKYKPDFIIANAENLAHGFGVTEKSIDELMEAGVDFFTSGNHIWKKKEGYELVSKLNPVVLRPHNYPPMNPGRGYKILEKNGFRLLVVSLLGRVFMREHVDCPFRAIDSILSTHEHEDINGIFVDFHAEATSEKTAFFHYLNGRVSAIAGTHTHIPTADAKVSEQGTAFITDVGMCGPSDSVIGHKKDQIIRRFLTQIETTHEVEEQGPCVVNSILITINASNRKGTKVEHLTIEIPI
jgi:metallophosphoesterase (TIGR00282 family)